MNVLSLDSSIMGNNSVSRHLTQAISQAITEKTGAEVRYHDLAEVPVHKGQSVPTVEDFLAADVIILGAPMYNFSIPSQLKEWIDTIAVAGKTFSYTAEGPKGLAQGKTVIVASTRGGIHGEQTDFQESYLKTFFSLLGVNDVRVVRAEGVNLSEESKASAIASALSSIPQVLETPHAIWGPKAH